MAYSQFHRHFGLLYISLTMSASPKVRLCFATNQNHREVKPAVVDQIDFEVILKAGSSKLRVKAKRLFTAEGVEITPDNVGSFPVRLVTIPPVPVEAFNRVERMR